MYAALGIAFLGLGALIWDFVSDGGVGRLVGLHHELPVAHHPGELGRRVGARRHAVPDGHLRRASSCRSASPPRSTSRSTPTEPLVEPADRGQHPEPRRRCRRSSTASSAWPSSCAGRSAWARCCWRARSRSGCSVLPVVIIVAREAIRAVPPSIREGSLALGATQWQTIWKQVLPGSIARHRDRRHPCPVARDRRDCAAPRHRRGGVRRASTPTASTARSPRCRSRSSHRSQDPNQEFITGAAGAICVLMIILLLMNSVAIWLRNRYEQKW